MQLTIPSNSFSRISNVSRDLPFNEDRDWLRSVFIEVKNGHAWIGATNSIFAAIEYLGPRESENGFLVVHVDHALEDTSEGATLTVNEWAGMNFCSISATNGYVTNGDVAIRDPEVIGTFRNWRNWLPDETPAEPGRAMFLDAEGMHALIQSSPSRCVTFPKFINANKAVLVRDTTEAHWLGVFLARPKNGFFLDGATLPDWID